MWLPFVQETITVADPGFSVKGALIEMPSEASQNKFLKVEFGKNKKTFLSDFRGWAK